MPEALTGALAALSAATLWGFGDFSGGMGVKATGGSVAGALRLVIVAHATSLVVLVALCFAFHAPVPHGAPMYWGLAAGVCAAIALTAFYLSLSRGAMGPSAALSGLLAASIPAVVSSLTEGVPGPLKLAGFALAAVAIWAIAAGNVKDSRSTIALAITGGLGFGFYFVALKMSNPLGAIEPMALARAASLVACTLLWLAVRGKGEHASPSKAPWLTRTAFICSMGVALFDTAGNLLFIAATRLGRLDVAAVLASLYPASTILLAAWQLHERPTRRQLAGMGLALVAVIMVSI